MSESYDSMIALQSNGNQALERHGCIVFDLKRNLGYIKSFRIAREALIVIFVCSILMNTMLMNIP